MLALPRSRLPVLGIAVLAGYALHAAVSIARGEAWNLLWACNVATLALGIGCLARHPRLVAVPMLWLAIGGPLWLIDLLNGGALTPTSPLIHVGAPIAAVIAARSLGVPRGTWLVAAAAAIALVALSRVMTPRAFNVNLSYGIYAGWEGFFSDPILYAAVVAAVIAASFVTVERLMRRAPRAPTGVAIRG